MCQETLSQNTHVCRAVQARHVTTGVIFFGWPSVGSETSGTARVLPNRLPEPLEKPAWPMGTSALGAGREGCAAARAHSKHSPGSSQRRSK